MERGQNNGFGGGFNLRFDQPRSDTVEPSGIEAVAVEPQFDGPRNGDDDGNGNRFDPERHSGRRNRDGSWSLKRGRQSGSSEGRTRKEKGSKTLSAANVEALKQTLVIFHAGIAAFTKSPEWNLDDEDAKTLSGATANFLVEFDIQPDPKVSATVGLVFAIASVEGPKIYLIRERIKEEAQKKKAGKPDLNLVS